MTQGIPLWFSFPSFNSLHSSHSGSDNFTHWVIHLKENPSSLAWTLALGRSGSTDLSHLVMAHLPSNWLPVTVWDTHHPSSGSFYWLLLVSITGDSSWTPMGSHKATLSVKSVLTEQLHQWLPNTVNSQIVCLWNLFHRYEFLEFIGLKCKSIHFLLPQELYKMTLNTIFIKIPNISRTSWLTFLGLK